MDTKRSTSTPQDRPGSSIVYKVWVEIEQYDEITGVGINMDAPGASLAEFSSYEDAYEFVRLVQQTFETEGLPPYRTDRNPAQCN